ncbi:MAG: Unknown protein [uncultured Sulfurovum sp.]|uniref:Uncharacterized protein n=1 Tax=uncultured Sulfurovum sp. TaxID=269237 RepID=A0A6S6TNF8_9BACT|nr:MAG: Unknown protein [uncultured Sulfurovum sp.]
MTNQTSRVLELLKRFNNGQKVCIETLQNDDLWLNKSEKTIRRDLDVIKEYFPESFELIRASKGEKGCYKAITTEVFNNFLNKETLALMVQTFDISQKNNVLDSLNINDVDKRIIETKIKKSKECYSFISKPYESTKSDILLIKDIEKAINQKRYLNLVYEVNQHCQIFTVKPYKIVFMNENFYLACENTSDAFLFTNFRLSNIKEVELHSKTFHLNYDILEFIKQIQTPFSKYTPNFRMHLIEIILEVSTEKAKFFKAKKYLPSQQILEEKEDGTLIISYTVTQEIELEELIKKWIPFLKVLSPLSLKEKIENDLRNYLNP